MSLGQIVRQRREELGLTQDRLVARVGISKPYLSNIETGRAKNPPADRVLDALEKALDLPGGQLSRLAHLARTPADIRKEHELLEAKVRKLRAVLRSLISGNRAPPDNLEELLCEDPPLAISAGMAVPVVNTTSGYPVRFASLDDLAGAAQEYVRLPDLHDPQAFALRVVADHMEPQYRQGDIVVISPGTPPRDGDDCFVRFHGDAGATFRRFYRDNEQAVRLQPLNSKYPPGSFDRAAIGAVWPAVLRLQPVRGDR